MVSVIMPYYNTPLDLTRRALESVAIQGEIPLEVVVVDDGSEPEAARGVAALLGEFRGRFETRLLAQANAGPGVARNRGVAEARYDLAAFLDSDDYWPPDSLRVRVEVLEKYADTWMVCAGARVEDASGALLAEHWGPDWVDTFAGGPARLYLTLFRVNRVNNSTVCLRREPFLELDGFDGALENSEDYDLWFRACRRELGFRYLDRPLTTLVHYGGNYSRQVGRRRRAEAGILRRELEAPPALLDELPQSLVATELARAWFRVGRYQAAAGQSAKARQAFGRSFALRLRAPAAWRWALSWFGL